VDALRELAIAPGKSARVPLGAFDLPAGAVPLALRASWELDPVSGEFLLGGASFPASALAVDPCETVRLAPWLPAGDVEPAELARTLAQPRFSTPAMLERAVRIPRERRAEALDLATPVLLSMDRFALARAVPALRWLAGRTDLGADAAAWRRWIEARAEKRRLGQDATPGLELPDVPESSIAATEGGSGSPGGHP